MSWHEQGALADPDWCGTEPASGRRHSQRNENSTHVQLWAFWGLMAPSTSRRSRGSCTTTPGEWGTKDGPPNPESAPSPCPCPAQRHSPPPRQLTLISAGVILRLVGRCLTVAALESASAMSGLSVGSAAAARISSSFSAQPRRRLSRDLKPPTAQSSTAASAPCC